MTAPAHRPDASEEPRTQRVWCRAPHPDRYKSGSFECANLLGDIPAGYRFVKVEAERPPVNGDGRVWVQCSRKTCRAWNVFERADDGEA